MEVESTDLPFVTCPKNDVSEMVKRELTCFCHQMQNASWIVRTMWNTAMFFVNI